MLLVYLSWATQGAVYYWHHAVTLAVLIPVLFSERLHFFAAACALVESTNPMVRQLITRFPVLLIVLRCSLVITTAFINPSRRWA